MTTLSSVLLVILVAPAYDDKPKDKPEKPEELLIGKWQGKVKEGDTEFDMTIEFARDGSLKSEVKIPDVKDPITIKGKYKVVDGGKSLETEVTFMGETKKDKDTLKVTKDKLTLTDDKGKTVELTRVK